MLFVFDYSKFRLSFVPSFLLCGSETKLSSSSIYVQSKYSNTYNYKLSLPRRQKTYNVLTCLNSIKINDIKKKLKDPITCSHQLCGV